MNNRKYIGQKIFNIRQQKGLSVEELATASGLTAANVMRIESGKYSFDVDILFRICDALGCEIDLI